MFFVTCSAYGFIFYMWLFSPELFIFTHDFFHDAFSHDFYIIHYFQVWFFLRYYFLRFFMWFSFSHVFFSTCKCHTIHHFHLFLFFTQCFFSPDFFFTCRACGFIFHMWFSHMNNSFSQVFAYCLHVVTCVYLSSGYNIFKCTGDHSHNYLWLVCDFLVGVTAYYYIFSAVKHY